jgi:FKBP-type peptidyl-prolyl cis-trans isomerase SlyD
MTNHFISISYKLFVRDEEDQEERLSEECSENEPFQFISHLGMVLKGFENALEELHAGDSFDFSIAPADAYGDFQDELMFDIPRSAFEVGGKFDDRTIFEGNVITLQDKDGQRYNATVIEVGDENVTVDINHPHAGETLHFVGQVLEHREASNEELTQMINQLSGGGCSGCHGGGCGSGSCGSGDGGCGCGSSDGGCGNGSCGSGDDSCGNGSCGNGGCGGCEGGC